MTETQRNIFSQLLDANWEADHGKTATERWDAAGKVIKLKAELKAEMGEDEYNTFIEQGKKMFAPVNA